MNRYQVYLNPQSVSILDEAAEVSGLPRSLWIREAIDAAASRVGNLLAGVKPVKKSKNYSELDKLVGAFKVKGKKVAHLSTNVDEIYY